MLNDGKEWVIQQYLFHCTTKAGVPYTTNDISNCAVIVSREDLTHAMHTITPTPMPTPIVTQIVNHFAVSQATLPTYYNPLTSQFGIIMIVIIVAFVSMALLGIGGSGGSGGYCGGGSYDLDNDDDDDIIIIIKR